MKNYLVFILAGISMALAAHFPETIVSGVFALICASLLAYGMRATLSPKKSLFLFSFVFHAIAFYWLPKTLQLFGGIPFVVSLLLMLLYCFVSSIQFGFCAWVYTRLSGNKFLIRYRLAFPFAWLLSLALFPRVFPWAIVHPMIKVVPVASIASFLGVMPLCMLMIWWGELFCSLLVSFKAKSMQEKPAIFAVSIVSFIALSLGFLSNSSVREAIKKAPSLSIGMVQGNLNAKQKGNIRMLSANIARYRELSEVAVAKGAQLLVWPESVLNTWIPEDISSVASPRDNFYPNLKLPLIFGGLSFSRRTPQQIAEFNKSHPDLIGTRIARDFETKRYNAGFGMLPGGDFVGRYYKRVLMPFGEFMPFTSYFPSLKKYLPPTGDFTEGELTAPLEFKIERLPETVKASLLICYEDLIPSLSLEAVKNGANILVNLTNDAWYGDTVASHQHHMLAAWRAIESRRYMLRATNTGYTGIVDPLGNTFEHLPTFKEDVLVSEAKLLEIRSLYSKVGDYPVYIFCLFILVLTFRRKAT